MSKQKVNNNFLQLIEQNRGIILKICNSYCQNKNDREDLAQEIVYHLFKSGEKFDSTYKFSTWMYRVALNVAISFYRKHQQVNAFYELNEEHTYKADTPIDTTNDAETKSQLLQQFINELKELDKALMILYLESKTYREIAEILGITETNVATKINRIKEKLKQKFSFINY